jgi:hypothetical protein
MSDLVFTIMSFFRSAVDGLKVGMQGGGEFSEQLTGGDCSVTIVYFQVKEEFAKLFTDLKETYNSVPGDEMYR